MRVVVFGAGSLGSLVGGLLAREHDVVLVGRDPHMTTVCERGLRVVGRREFAVTLDAATDFDGRADLAVVTVKAHDVPAAAGALAGADVAVALPLTNGLGAEKVLADRLDVPVLGGTTTYGAVLRESGVVECTGEGSVTLGPLPGVTTGDDPATLAAQVGDAFDDAGVEVTVESDMRGPIWTKLAVNAGVNPVTALADVPNGALADGPAAATAREAAREAAAVAREAGVDLSGDTAADALADVVASTAANSSSMRQDVEAGRRTEVDAINGAVVELATAPVPVNATLVALVRAWEAGRGFR